LSSAEAHTVCPSSNSFASFQLSFGSASTVAAEVEVSGHSRTVIVCSIGAEAKDAISTSAAPSDRLLDIGDFHAGGKRLLP
jgi:hypothetical protein